MKRRAIHMIITVMLVSGPFFICPVLADEPPPPPPHGSGGDIQPGGGASIGNGTVLLLFMGAAYGLKRLYERRRKLIE